MAVHGNRDIFGPGLAQPPAGDGNGNTGLTFPPTDSMDTSGRNSGLGYSETGQADVQAYKETRAAVSGGAHCGGGPGIALPTGDSRGDHSDRFSTVGQIPADSNMQSTGVAGGPLADHSFLVREGGSDASAQEAEGFGGRSLL